MHWGVVASFLGAITIGLLIRAGTLSSLFSANYVPRRFCYLATPGLVWTHVITDALIAASYALLFGCMLLIARRLRAVSPLRPYAWILLSFATFILACGLTHLMEVVTVWWPFYPLSAAMKVLCAAVSIPTAVFFARATPTIVVNAKRFFDLLAGAERAVEAGADSRDQIEAINRCQMMIEFNMDGTILRANPSVLQRFGYTPAELAGKDHSVILSEEDKGSARQRELWEQLRLGRFQSGEFRRVGAGGREVWVEVRYTPIAGPDGLPRKVVGFATDETERVHQRLASERRIRETEARLQTIVDNVPVGIVLIDEAGGIVSVNRAATRMFGFEADRIVGQDIKTLVPRFDLAGEDAPVSPGDGQELEGLTRDGRAFPVELTVTGAQDGGRRMRIALIRDITESKCAEQARTQQEEALRKSQQFLVQTGRLAGIGGWEVDLATNEVTWAAETYRILGADPSYRPTLEEAIDLYTPECRPVIRAALARAIHEGVGWDLELTHVRLDGRQIWARTVGSVEFAQGKPVRLRGVFQDIGLRVAERQALEQANARVALATESGGIGIWERDFETGRLSCDAWMYRLYGLGSEVTGAFDHAFWRQHLHPEDLPLVERALREHIEGSRPYEVEFRIVWDDGSLHSIKATGQVSRDEAGNAVRMVGTNRDTTVRRQAEEALRKSEEFLKQTGKLAGVGGWEINLETNRVYWSPETYRLMGADPSYQSSIGDALGRLSPESAAAIRAAMAKARSDRQGWDLELSMAACDGRQMWVRSVSTVECVDGKPLWIRGAFQDVTERVAERQAIEHANTRAALATDSGGIGIWDWDIRADTFTCDAWMYRLYGLEPDSGIGRDFAFWARHVHPEDRPSSDQALLDAIDGTEPFDTDFRIVWDDGSVHHIRATAKIARDEAGQALRVVGTNCDITDRVAEQTALREANTRAALATDSGGIAIWDWNLDTGKVTADDWMYRICGLDPAAYHLEEYELWARHVHPDDRPAVEQALKDGIDEIRPYETEYRILWADGSLHYIKASGQVIRDKAGKARRMVGTNCDITARKLAEQEIQKARFEAEEANRAKSDFLANMSHEVRTPVNAILGMSHLALRANPSEQQRGYLNKIDKAGNRLLSIMNDILDFSKIEAGKLTLEAIVFPLEEVLQNLRDTVGQKAEQKRVPIAFSVAPEVPRYLVGDPLRLGQILINLVNNAIKFTDRGEIAVKVFAGGDRRAASGEASPLEFSVSDTGIGMTASQVEHLFQSFHQADTSFTRQYGGTGLGLAISKQLTELMGGRIWVESEIGVGSCFHFTVSLAGAAEDLSLRLKAPIQVAAIAPGGRSILVVDDSEQDRSSMAELLRGGGHAVRSVSSGEEALTALIAASQAGQLIDMVLMDWQLPGINGIETARRIKTSRMLARTPAIVMFSAFARDEVMAGANDIALEGYLMKPVKVEELEAVVNGVSAVQNGDPGAQPTTHPSLNGRKVLLVEDNDLNRELAIELLGDLGVSVTVAVNGRDAVSLIDTQAFDLVLMDIQMPVMDGLTATKLIRVDSRFHSLPILAMTAHAMSGDRDRSLNAGMNDHITKPIDPDGLTRMLLRWMPGATPAPQAAATPTPMQGDDLLPDQLPPFNLPAALARTNNKPRLLRKMLIGFRDQYANAVAELRANLREHKEEQAERLAHSLKSIAATLEAKDLAEASAAIEAALRAGVREGLEGLIDRLAEELDPAVRAASVLERRVPDGASLLPERTADPACERRGCILLVDDEPLVLKLLADTFQDYEIVMAKEGEAALQIAAIRVPEIILLDVNMPGMDGFEVCRRLKEEERTREIPVVFITGRSDVASETEGLKLGAADYVAKPMNPAVLRARVNNQFELKRAQVDLLRILAKRYLDDMVDELERSAALDRNRQLQLQMKDEFLSHISHELRSPLSSIHSFVTLVTDQIAGETNAEQDEYLGIVLSNVGQLKAMINDLLESTRVKTGKLNIELEAVSVVEAAEFVVRSLQQAAREKSISLSLQVPEELSAAYADPTRLRQCLVILLDNAIKFTPLGGKVSVSVRVYERDPAFLLVEIADTGCGISADATESVFERLFQVSHDDQGGRKGLGLGLHIAKELVRRQGGAIWVDSVLGQGSQFCFTVPIVAADVDRPAHDAGLESAEGVLSELQT